MEKPKVYRIENNSFEGTTRVSSGSVDFHGVQFDVAAGSPIEFFQEIELTEDASVVFNLASTLNNLSSQPPPGSPAIGFKADIDFNISNGVDVDKERSWSVAIYSGHTNQVGFIGATNLLAGTYTVTITFDVGIFSASFSCSSVLTWVICTYDETIEDFEDV